MLGEDEEFERMLSTRNAHEGLAILGADASDVRNVIFSEKTPTVCWSEKLHTMFNGCNCETYTVYSPKAGYARHAQS